MKKTGFDLQDFSIEHFLSLMDVYLTDRITRHQVLWDFAFRFFYATLIVLFFPNLSAFLGVELPGFPKILFPIIALIMSITFLFICIGLAKKAEVSGETFIRMTEFLPPELQRPRTHSKATKYKTIFKWRFRVPADSTMFLSLSIPVISMMFLSLAILSIVMIFYNIHE